MKGMKYIICAVAATIGLSAYSVMAADVNVTDAHFEQNGKTVHTLSNGGLDCVIKSDNTDSGAVMINAVYEKNTNKLVKLEYKNSSNGEFKNSVDVTNADNTYVTMCVWDGLESANAKTQVYSIAAEDTAPEMPWNVKVNNNGVVEFSWGICEDNLKTVGYNVYKNNEKIADVKNTEFKDTDVHWYDSGNDYAITSYDEYGNESEKKSFSNVEVDKSNMAAILFSQPNIAEKMSLYFATGKENDDSWYGYNVAAEKDGVQCRRIPADSRAVFKYSTDFKNRIGSDARDAIIRVTYFDDNTDAFRISYVGKGARYTDINIDKTNTNKWITKDLKVSDLVEAYIDPKDGPKVQDESIDFTIWSKASTDKGDVVDTDTYIAEIQVILEGDLPEPEPTAEPGTSPKPTAEPTTEPTTAPTINPADIKSASITFKSGQTIGTCSESDYNLINIFWAGKNNDGQINSPNWYGYNTGETVNGEECRAIADNKRLVLVYDNKLNEAIGTSERSAKLRVRYLDKGTDKIKVSYISKTKRYSDLNIQKADSGEWKWAEFDVTDLVSESDQTNGNNGGYQDGKINDEGALYPQGPNVSIWSRGSSESESETEYISAFEIVLDDSAVEPTVKPTTTPTTEPITEPTTKPTTTPVTEPTTKPTATPTATPIAEPTTAPTEIKSASITFKSGQTTDTCSESEDNLINIFWAGKNNDGQINVPGWYGYNSGETMNEEECRAIADNKRLVLIYDSKLNDAIGTDERSAKLRVRYLDNGTDKIRVSYISKTKRYSDLNIQKTDSGEWKWAEFDVTDLVSKSDQTNGNNDGYQDGKINDEGALYPQGPNISIWSRGSGESESVTEYISAFELILQDSTNQSELE